MNFKQKSLKFISTFLLIVFLFSEIGVLFENTTSISAATETGTVTASTLIVRKGPGTNYSQLTYKNKKVTLKKNASVKILNTKSKWYYISFSYSGTTLKGYVSSDYVSKKLSSCNYIGKVTASNLYVRKGPGTNYAILTKNNQSVKLTKNTIVNVKKSSGNWYYIAFTYNSTTTYGYVSSSYISKVNATSYSITGKTNASKLNVRKGPGTFYSNIAYNNKTVSLSKGTTVKVTKKIGNWYYCSFKYSGKTLYGYVSSSYINKVTTTNTSTATPTPTSTASASKAPAATATPTSTPTTVTTSSNSLNASTSTYDSSIKYSGSKNGVVNVDTCLNVRTGAGTSYNILTIGDEYVRLSDGYSVSILDTIGSWYKISFSYDEKTYTGYVYKSYISFSYKINYGIDVSKWQEDINWEKVADDGVKFAFIRIGYRGSSYGKICEDSYAEKNIKGALAAGIKVGVYFFSTAITDDEALEEAKWTCNYIKKYNITYPVVYDYESYNDSGARCYGVSSSRRTSYAITFLDYVKTQGYTPMFYNSKYALDNEWSTSQLENRYDIWLANYTSVTTYSGKYSIWQYTDSGKVSGINGNVDLNYEYIN